MHEEDSDNLKNIAGCLYFDDRTIRDVDAAIVSDVEIADRASDTLYHIRKNIRKENENIREKLRRILKSNEHSATLQDSIITQRNGRYVVPVKQEHRSSVPGIVHAQSGSGATLFIEPMSVVESNNRISELKVDEQAEIEHILSRLSSFFRKNIQEIRETAEALSLLDIIFAKASLGISMKAVPVEFSEDETFKILKGRHPLIDAKSVIPIDIEMKKGVRSLIITGPNTGGKTVTLKLCGLFALMALGAKKGDTLEFTVTGENAEETAVRLREFCVKTL